MGMLVRISNNIYYLSSFSTLGGRGTEALVLLVCTFLSGGRGTEALVLLVSTFLSGGRGTETLVLLQFALSIT